MVSSRHDWRTSPGQALGSAVLRFAVFLLISASVISAVKLKISSSECVSETIEKPLSLVTIAFVATPFRGSESYFDVQVKDPRGYEIYAKEELETAEISFKNQMAGTHTICFTVSKKNASLSSGIASPRVSKKLREIFFDIQVGETWSHERVKTEHLDELMEDISSLKTRIQKLRSEVRYLKFREIRHRKTVKSTARRVTRYSLGKMIVIIIIAIAQPVIIAIFFQRQFKY